MLIHLNFPTKFFFKQQEPLLASKVLSRRRLKYLNIWILEYINYQEEGEDYSRL